MLNEVKHPIGVGILRFAQNDEACIHPIISSHIYGRLTQLPLLTMTE